VIASPQNPSGFQLFFDSVFIEPNNNSRCRQAGKMKDQLQQIPDSLEITLADRSKEFDPTIYKQLLEALKISFDHLGPFPEIF